MDCTFIKLYLEAYEKGQLDEQRERGISKHLECCEDCRIEVEEIRVVNAMFDAIKVPSLPSDFTSNVMKKVRESSSTPNKSIWQEFGKMGASLVAAGLIMLLLNFTSIGVNIATLTANISKTPLDMNKIYEYSPSSIFNRGLDQIENIIETIESRR